MSASERVLVIRETCYHSGMYGSDQKYCNCLIPDRTLRPFVYYVRDQSHPGKLWTPVRVEESMIEPCLVVADPSLARARAKKKSKK